MQFRGRLNMRPVLPPPPPCTSSRPAHRRGGFLRYAQMCLCHQHIAAIHAPYGHAQTPSIAAIATVYVTFTCTSRRPRVLWTSFKVLGCPRTINRMPMQQALAQQQALASLLSRLPVVPCLDARARCEQGKLNSKREVSEDSEGHDAPARAGRRCPWSRRCCAQGGR